MHQCKTITTSHMPTQKTVGLQRDFSLWKCALFQGRLLHYFRKRMLAVRECARFQGFPDWFVFEGKRKSSPAHKHKQIGNAVAVPLARALGQAIAHAANKEPPT